VVEWGEMMLDLRGGVMPIETDAALDPIVASAAKIPVQSKMPDIIQGPILSHYMDFRKYLLDFYEYKRALTKKDIRPYNFGVFSAAADIKSPNYLKMIIDGKRNLSEDMIGKFSKALGFNKELSSEFRVLVNFCQATDPAERNFFLKELTSLRVEIQLKNGEIDQKTWEKVPNWVAWILHAMLDQRGVQFKIDELKDLLRGKASINEIQEAMDILVRSGEMVPDETTGSFKKGRNLIDSPEDIPVALVRKLQSQLMYLGLESLYQDSATDREFGSLTLALTKEEFEQLKFQLRKMRKEINKDNSIRRLSEPGERVYQLNLQLFPVTNSSK
jgi:uncharacterized protein (TIGR02147 family)